MKRLTTAYERVWTDGSAEMQYMANASDLEVVNRLGTYEDAEEEGRLFVVPCKPGDVIYEVEVFEHPEWNCHVRGFIVQDVSTKQVKYSDDWVDWDAPYLYTDEKEAEAKTRQLRNQRKRLESGWIPVTERLPENGDYVLMSFENFPLASTGYYVGNKETGGNWYLANWIDEYTCLANDLFVNAWMPLPKPYREDEEHGNIP